MVKATAIPLDQLRHQLAECVQRVSFGRERILVTFHGKATCALVPLEDFEKAGGKVDLPRRAGKRPPK